MGEEEESPILWAVPPVHLATFPSLLREVRVCGDASSPVLVEFCGGMFKCFDLLSSQLLSEFALAFIHGWSISWDECAQAMRLYTTRGGWGDNIQCWAPNGDLVHTIPKPDSGQQCYTVDTSTRWIVVVTYMCGITAVYFRRNNAGPWALLDNRDNTKVRSVKIVNTQHCFVSDPVSLVKYNLDTKTQIGQWSRVSPFPYLDATSVVEYAGRTWAQFGVHIVELRDTGAVTVRPSAIAGSMLGVLPGRGICMITSVMDGSKVFIIPLNPWRGLRRAWITVVLST
jgi:hypothetical protein